MLVIERPADVAFLHRLQEILAGWSGRAIDGNERNDLADRLADVLAHAKPGCADQPT